MASRLNYGKPNNYSKKVLVGSWREERSIDECPSDKKFYGETTTYSDSYVVKPRYTIEDPNFILQSEQGDGLSFFQNYSSTYDLSFNHFPKWYKGVVPRKRKNIQERYDLQDYIPPFGNLTNHGLAEYKRENWKCEKKPVKRVSTHYRDTFRPPRHEDYKFQRHAIPISNSSIMENADVSNQALQLRDKPTWHVPPPSKLVTVPRPGYFDPITWKYVPPTASSSQNFATSPGDAPPQEQTSAPPPHEAPPQKQNSVPSSREAPPQKQNSVPSSPPQIFENETT